MENFIDPFLSSASWSELHTSPRSSWVASQTNGLLANSLEAYEDDEKNPHVCMIPSGHIIGNVGAEELDMHAHSDTSSIFTDESLKYLSHPELPNHHSQTIQEDNETYENSFPLKGVFGSNSTSPSVRLPQSALAMSNSMENNNGDHLNFPLSLGDANSVSPVPTVWRPSYSDASSFMDEDKLQTFGFQGVGSNGDVLRTSYIDNGKYQHFNHSAAPSLPDHSELQTSHLPTFSLGQQMKVTSSALRPHQQEQDGLPKLQLPSFCMGPQLTMSKSLSRSTEGNIYDHHANHSSGGQHQATPANASGCNGTGKPRVRARRGQATDPHSIAERLRREKITERMKNLQELVPNSNKTDKASMLDEIVDYVKFLRLQVKVLSMSRLGAAGAVVPLITDVESEGSAQLHLSSMGQQTDDISETEDNLAFEQEVVKMMESNITTAMQYLQNKGLCLMPIALASAISTQKGSSAAATPLGRRKPEESNGAISEINDLSLVERSIGENRGLDGCNGGVKQEVLKSI